jgi:hypothetical protein
MSEGETSPMSDDQSQQGAETGGLDPQLDAGRAQRLLQAIYSTQPDELPCDDCFELVDAYAEMVMAGVDAARVLPLVQDHLKRCPACREEFEALIDALRGLSGPPTE